LDIQMCSGFQDPDKRDDQSGERDPVGHGVRAGETGMRDEPKA